MFKLLIMLKGLKKDGEYLVVKLANNKESYIIKNEESYILEDDLGEKNYSSFDIIKIFKNKNIISIY